jgi:hypothetical protein
MHTQEFKAKEESVITDGDDENRELPKLERVTREVVDLFSASASASLSTSSSSSSSSGYRERCKGGR